MAKNKRAAGHRPVRQIAPAALDMRQQGLRAFQAGRFNVAIAAWTDLASRDPRLAPALAEAHFRRALTRPATTDRLADLERAIALAPTDLRYQYHLGLARHLRGDLAGARQSYQAVLERDPAWPGAGLVLALAALDEAPGVDLATLPGTSRLIRETLAPVVALVRGERPAVADDGPPLTRLWAGLARVQAGDPAAAEALGDSRPLPTAGATAVRRYYQGVAAALAGDLAGATTFWHRLDSATAHHPWVQDNLAAVAFRQLDQARQAGDLARAVAIAEQLGAAASGNPALGEAVVRTLDEAAQAAATQGDWEQAARLWEAARQVVSTSTGLGSPRPLLQNLALAHEAREEWLAAADAWRAMLRTRPRRGSRAAAAGAEEGGLSEAQWAWVRRRVIECYQHGDAPGEAVTMYRQLIKADATDLEARLQLADALLANDQPQAALNEVERILQIDPQHVEARLRLATLQSDRGYWGVAQTMLRELVERLPEREDVRQHFVQMLRTHGEHYLQSRDLRHASAAFEEGARLAPTDYIFPLNLARVAVEQHQIKQAGELVERVLTLAATNPDAYMMAVECWVVANKPAEARAVLARAEAAFPLTPTFLVRLGGVIIRSASAHARATVMAPRPADAARTSWETWGAEVLDRAIALRPDDGDLRSQIVGELGPTRPDLALPHAEAAARLKPDDARALTALGLIQGMSQRGKEGKETLRRAARLARQQGNLELAEQAEQMRQIVDSPMFGLLLQLGPLLGDLDLDDTAFDDLGFGDLDLDRLGL